LGGAEAAAGQPAGPLQEARSRWEVSEPHSDPIGCEEALRLWEAELAGQQVERARMEQALTHIGQCQKLCAQVLATSPIDTIERIARISGHGDVYEALGLSYEDEGDAHHRRYKRLRKLGQASQEEVEREYALAQESWQAATRNYEAGLRFFKSMFLTDAMKRMKRKLALRPPAPPLEASPALEEMLYFRKIDRLLLRPGENYYTSVLALALPSSPQGRPRLAHPAPDWAILPDAASPSFLSASSLGASFPQVSQEWGSAGHDLVRVEGQVGPLTLALAVEPGEEDDGDLRVLVHPHMQDDPHSAVMLNLRQREPQPRAFRVFPQRLGTSGLWSGGVPGLASGSYALAVAARRSSGEVVVADIDLTLTWSRQDNRQNRRPVP
jgi:hypothetical protein